MEQTLIASGIACIIAAIVGGGLKAFKIEIPALKSVARQVSLGLFGVMLIAAGFMVNRNSQTPIQPGSNNDSGQTQAETPTSSPEDSDDNDTSDDNNQTTEPAEEHPPSDFPDGSSRVYAADFTNWERPNTEHGNISLGFGDILVLEPSSNTWIGASSDEVTGVNEDFVCDLRFRIEEQDSDASINLTLENTGDYAERVDLYFSVWGSGEVNYTLTKGHVRRKEGEVPHVVRDETVAEREEPASSIQQHDWSTGSELTLKRTGGNMQFFINDHFVKEFDTSVFRIKGISVGAAHPSTIHITSLELREPS